MSGCTCVKAATRGQAAALQRFASGMGMVVSVRGPQMSGFTASGSGQFDPTTGGDNSAPTPQPADTFHPADTGGATEGTFGTTPGSVPVVASAWRFDTHPATYEAQSGDTFTGLAKTYLPSSPPGVRWKEIWNLNRDTHPSPDVIGVGDVLVMPDEAASNAKKAAPHGGQPQPQQQGSLGRALLIGAAIAVTGTAIAYGAQYMAKRSKRRPQLRAA